MFNFTDSDYKIMAMNDWSESYVENTLLDYQLDYGLSFEEVNQIFQFYGVNELFDGILIACEEYADMISSY